VLIALSGREKSLGPHSTCRLVTVYRVQLF
jgi:hypothetical protein